MMTNPDMPLHQQSACYQSETSSRFQEHHAMPKALAAALVFLAAIRTDAQSVEHNLSCLTQPITIYRQPDGRFETRTVKIPSGKIQPRLGLPLDSSVPASRLASDLPDFFAAKATGVTFWDGQQLIAAFGSARGVLDGRMIVLSPTSVACAGAYSSGKLNGDLLTFSDDGKPILFGHFDHGKRDGEFFLFDGRGSLELAAVYKVDNLEHGYRVENGKIADQTAPDGSVPFGGPLAVSIGRLRSRIDEFKDKEKTFKKLVADADEADRRKLAAANSVDKRNAILNRGAADNTATIQRLFRWQNSFGASQGR
jgi:hypothetical protein